jgi:hypothetical protein
VSFQITILKVLAGQPEGRACVADLTRYVSILMSSGSDWASRTRRLADLAPQLDIFGSAFVLRDDSGWQIKDLGRQFLDSIEAMALAAHHLEQSREVVVVVIPRTATAVQPRLRLVVDNNRTAQAEGEPDPTRLIA